MASGHAQILVFAARTTKFVDKIKETNKKNDFFTKSKYYTNHGFILYFLTHPFFTDRTIRES